MKRLLYHDLCKWKAEKHRKPLILRGARQVGKTHIIRQFSHTFEQFIEINFEKTPDALAIFSGNLDPVRLSRDIEIFTNQKIIPGKTLIFFDEVQVEPRIITALRYYYEEMPNLHVVAAGSLVDFAIESVGVPVGRVTFMHMYPMSFIEYLKATQNNILAKEIIKHSISESINESIHNKALKLAAEYMAIGGMPEVVSTWIDTNDITAVENVKSDIIDAYRQDTDKYASMTQIKYLEFIYERLPRLMGTRFKYSSISKEFRKRELGPCLELLSKARVVHKVYHTRANGFPIGAESDLEKFKVVPLDIGLSQKMLGLELKNWFLNPNSTLINKGEITECFVGQEMLVYNSATDEKLYYWQRETRGSSSEVDYIIIKTNKIIPVEVKSGAGTALKSMRIFLDSHPNSPYGIRFSVHNYSVFDSIHSYPLYAVASVMSNHDRVLEFIES